MTYTANIETIFIDEQYILKNKVKCKDCLDEPLKAGSMCFKCDPRIK
jgi:hypothetical protein